jgi:transglutaminase-like putative cysteine protease
MTFNVPLGESAVINSSNMTEATVQAMLDIVRQQRKDALVRTTAENLIMGVPQKDWYGEIKKIFNFVRNKIRYTRDIHNVEFIKTPLKQLTDMQSRGVSFGDCDCHSVLLSALLESIGHKTRFVIIRTVSNPADTYNHVFVQVFEPEKKQWITTDATAKTKDMGYEAPSLKRKVYHV